MNTEFKEIKDWFQGSNGSNNTKFLLAKIYLEKALRLL